jgi:hypothetical protein
MPALFSESSYLDIYPCRRRAASDMHSVACTSVNYPYRNSEFAPNTTQPCSFAACIVTCSFIATFTFRQRASCESHIPFKMSLENRYSVYHLGFVGPVLIATVFHVVRSLRHRLALKPFPGPQWANVTPQWLVRTYASGNLREVLARINHQYGKHSLEARSCCGQYLTSVPGKIVRIGSNHLVTDDPDLMWRILGTHSNYLTGPWFDSLRFDPHYSSIASERDVAKHDALRNKVATGVSCSDHSGIG